MLVDTHCPLEVWTNSVIKVDVAGHTQLSANIAYLNSSSQTTWSNWKGIIAKLRKSLACVSTTCQITVFQKLWILCTLTSKLNMKFIFWFENLYVERAVWSKVFCSPCPQNSLVILWGSKIVLFHLSSGSFSSTTSLANIKGNRV